MSKILAIFAGLLLAAVLIANISFVSSESDFDGVQLRFTDTSDCNKLDASQTSMGTDFRMLRCLFQTLLVVQHGGGGLEPGCVEPGPDGTGYTLSEDGRTYTLHIREDAAWSNGDPVTAHDFAYGWMRACLPDSPGPYISLVEKIDGVSDFNEWRQAQLDAYKNRENRSQEAADKLFADTYQHFLDSTGVNVIDDRTLTITLTTPTAYFPELLAFPTFSPIHRASVAEATNVDPDTAIALADPTYFSDGDRLIVNGPYRLNRWDHGERIILDRNRMFWNDAATVNDRIVRLQVRDATLAIRKFMAGEVDWVDTVDNAEIKEQIRSNNLCPYLLVPSASTYYYRFNCRETITGTAERNPFADRRVRRAFALAVERAPLIENITRNNDLPAYTFVPPHQIPGYLPPVEPEVSLHHNITEARRLLAEYEAEFGDITRVEISCNVGELHKNVLEVLARQWEKAFDLEVTVDIRDTNIHYADLEKGSFQIARAGWTGDYVDPTTFLEMFESDNSNNDSAYNSEMFDDKMTEAARELNPQRRLELLREAETILIQDAPLIPLFHANSLCLIDSERINLRPNAWNNLRLELTDIHPHHAQ